jgi:hypothetical protein
MIVENDILPTRALTLAEFVEAATEIYDPTRPQTVWELRQLLVNLAENREEVWHHLLKALAERIATPLPTEQAGYFILYNGKGFSIRATIWLPEGVRPEKSMIENGVFAYDYPHNHTFDLLTTVVMGEGYETDIYTIGELPKDTRLGEEVPCSYKGRHHLKKGTVFFYEACTDVHVQVPVQSLSVALNFLARSPLMHERSQYAFDIVDDNHLRTSGSPLSADARELLAIRLLAKCRSSGMPVGNQLERIAQSRAGSRVGDTASRYLSYDGDPDAMHEMIANELFLGASSSNYHLIARNVRERRVARDLVKAA